MSFRPEGFSEQIFKDRYAFTQDETWEQACLRVADQMSRAESPDKQVTYRNKFNDILVSNLFVPGGRIWYNSGRTNPQLLNCFVLDPAKDSKEGWGKSAYNMITTSMTGGGCGDDFSDIRPRGASISDQKGQAPGAVELMRLIDGCAKPVRNGGQRRVALMFSLDLDHPDIEEFLNAKLTKGELTHANVSVRSKRTKEFIKAVKEDGDWELSWKGKYKKTVKAKDIWNTIVTNAYNSAEPGFLNWELVENESNIHYIEPLVTTNPCVTGDTEILTRNGYVRIDSLIDSEQEIWNGFEWSTVTPKVTGYNQQLLTVTFSDGRLLTCTPYHKFHISTDYHGGTKIVEARDLASGMKLIKHEFPLIEGGVEYEHAYTQGFISAEGMDDYNFFTIYEPKRCVVNRLTGGALVSWDDEQKRGRFSIRHTKLPKNFVPFNWSVKSRLDWLSGLFDGDGTELREGGLQLVSVDRKFLDNTQKLLSTLGIQSKVTMANKAGFRPMPDGKGGTKDFYCQDAYRILIGAVQMQQLKKLGLKCERMAFDKTPQRDASQFVTVVDVTEAGTTEKVYCFNEPKRHLGIFGGVITGQCGEIALSAYDCCCLGHLVLPRFIVGDSIDYATLGDTIRTSVRFLDNVLSVNSYPLPEMKAKSHNLRRIGLGTTGLADTLAILGLRYGSEEGNKFVDKLYRFISKAAYEASVMLAVEKGAFPLCQPDKHVESGFMKRMPAKIRSLVKEHGIRNCAILTQAPTGTVSILSGNCSSGIEPMFAAAYERRFWVGEERKTELVLHPLFEQFMREGKSVDHFVGSHDLTVRDHMELQRIVQKHVDNAVSKTINIAEDYPLEEVEKLWLEYLPHLKGTTFYRENTRGYIDEHGNRQEPPLKALPLEEAKARFSEKHQSEVAFVDDCASGICSI